jgi:DNA-binding transcriptional LysR family regulator
MTLMQFPHIAKLDLKLIEPLFALLNERHVTRAAQRCNMSQSAMSRALERLRAAFDDELLVRSDGRYERTIRGDHLLAELQELLPRLDAVIRGDAFDPATTHEWFRIATTDYAAAILIPLLLARVEGAAPGAHIEITPWNNAVAENMESGRTHVAIIGTDNLKTYNSEPLFSDEFVCVVARDHPLRSDRVTLKQYLAFRHAVVTVNDGGQLWIENALASRGLERTVALRTPYQLSAVMAAARSTMVCTSARRLAMDFAPLADVRLVRAPREFPKIAYHMAWHSRLRDDAAQKWIRQQVRLAANDLERKMPGRPGLTVREERSARR